MDARSSLGEVYRTTAIVCGAMVVAVVLYAVVVEVVRVQHRPFRGFAPSPALEPLRYVFYALALGQAGVIRILRGPWARGTPAGDPAARLAGLRTSAIVTAALAEVPAICGLVLFLLGGAAGDFYLLLAWSLGLEFAYFPRYGQWEAQLRGSGLPRRAEAVR